MSKIWGVNNKSSQRRAQVSIMHFKTVNMQKNTHESQAMDMQLLINILLLWRPDGFVVLSVFCAPEAHFCGLWTVVKSFF